MGVQRTFGVFVTQRRFPHVAEAQGAFAATVDKQVAVVGVELGSCDHLRQVLHVGRLDVHDVWRKAAAQANNKKLRTSPAGTVKCCPVQMNLVSSVADQQVFGETNGISCENPGGKAPKISV